MSTAPKIVDRVEDAPASAPSSGSALDRAKVDAFRLLMPLLVVELEDAGGIKFTVYPTPEFWAAAEEDFAEADRRRELIAASKKPNKKSGEKWTILPEPILGTCKSLDGEPVPVMLVATTETVLVKVELLHEPSPLHPRGMWVMTTRDHFLPNNQL